MKSISRLVGIAAMAALPAIAQAQSTTTSRPVSFGVSGGASIPVSDLSDGVDVGYTVGAHVLLAPSSMQMLAFRGDVGFDSWNYKSAVAQALDGKFRALTVMGNVILKSSSAMSIKPYAIGGLGLVNTKSSAKAAGVTVSESNSGFGIQAGGGLEFQLSGFTTFIEAKFVNAFSALDDGTTSSDSKKSANWIPITFGIRF